MHVAGSQYVACVIHASCTHGWDDVGTQVETQPINIELAESPASTTCSSACVPTHGKKSCGKESLKHAVHTIFPYMRMHAFMMPCASP